jgi:riboflavin synthase
MFTGIVQGIASVTALVDRPGLRSISLAFAPGFAAGLETGASVASDGVCLTVTKLLGENGAEFDVMQQTLGLTTLSSLAVGSHINVERAARDGAEIGGHPLSGHIDFTGELVAIERPENNHVLRLAVAPEWMRYIFAKGYIAINGASLTIATADRQAGWFEVWLIPETLRLTTFGAKRVGDRLNIEIERSTQVMVDTVRDTVRELLGSQLAEQLDALLAVKSPELQALLRRNTAA